MHQGRVEKFRHRKNACFSSSWIFVNDFSGVIEGAEHDAEEKMGATWATLPSFGVKRD